MARQLQQVRLKSFQRAAGAVAEMARDGRTPILVMDHSRVAGVVISHYATRDVECRSLLKKTGHLTHYIGSSAVRNDGQRFHSFLREDGMVRFGRMRAKLVAGFLAPEHLDALFVVRPEWRDRFDWPEELTKGL